MTRTMPRESNFNLSPNAPPLLDGAGVDPFATRAIQWMRGIIEADIWPEPGDGCDGQEAGGPRKGKQDVAQQAVRGGQMDGPSFSAGMKNMLRYGMTELSKQPKGRQTLSEALRKDDRWGLYLQASRLVRGPGLSFNANSLLEQDATRSYLFAKALYVHGLDEAEAMASYMTEESEQDGLASLYREVVGHAAHALVVEDKIATGDPARFENYLRTQILPRRFSFEKGSLSADLRERIKRFAHHAGLLGHIQAMDEKLGLGVTPAELKHLIGYVKRSKLDLDKLDEAARFQLLFGALTRFRDAATTSLVPSDEPLDPVDFSVRYHTESADALAVNTNNVLCAAQLFYVMTLGDELGVFDAADLLVRKYLSRSRVDIQSQQVLQDLQNYALNDEFPDLATGRMYKRTNPEERRMFYRQVFNFGDSELMEGMVSNPDFEVLWRNLMVEDARYITAIRQSESPELYVSREGITQAVEALQQNLSTHCSGMAKVMTPVMYKELDFLIERILKSQEIVSQLALHNSRSYMKVVERILQEEHGRGVNVSALQKKAGDGHAILEIIAKYTHAMIADDAKFSNFVRLVYAFITTGEKLEGSDGGLFDAEEDVTRHVGVNGNGVGAPETDDWNF